MYSRSCFSNVASNNYNYSIPITTQRSNSDAIICFSERSSAYGGINGFLLDYTKKADANDSFEPSMVTDNILLNVAPSYDDYSTDEIVVGKWTNGKPVYRKTFIATSPTATSKEDLLTGIDLDMDDEVRLYGFVDLGIRRLPLNYYYSDAYNMACYYHKSNKKFILHISHADYANKPVVITIEYTKASDAANSFTPDMIKTIPMNDEVTTAQVDEVLDVLKGGK